MTSNRDSSAPHDGPMQSDEPAPKTQVAQRHYDPDEDDELATEVVYAIADARGVDPTEIKSTPLYECVDVAALEDMFFGPDVNADSRQGRGRVEFPYEELLVQVSSDGWIQVFATVD